MIFAGYGLDAPKYWNDRDEQNKRKSIKIMITAYENIQNEIQQAITNRRDSSKVGMGKKCTTPWVHAVRNETSKSKKKHAQLPKK